MTAGERWFPVLAWRRNHTLTDGFDPPIRAEVFGLERLEAYARTLAEAAAVSPGRGRVSRTLTAPSGIPSPSTSAAPA